MSRKRFLKEVVEGVGFADVHKLLFKMICGALFEQVFLESDANTKFLEDNNLVGKLFLLIAMSQQNDECFFAKNYALCNYDSVIVSESSNSIEKFPVFKFCDNEVGWLAFQNGDISSIICNFEDGGKIECFKDRIDLWTITIEVPMEGYSPNNTKYYYAFNNIFENTKKDSESYVPVLRPYQGE